MLVMMVHLTKRVDEVMEAATHKTLKELEIILTQNHPLEEHTRLDISSNRRCEKSYTK